MNTTGGGLHFDATLSDSQFQASLNRINQGINRTTANVLSAGDQMDQLAKRAAAGIGAYFSVQAFKDFAGQIVEIRSQFQQLEISFSTMLKSKMAADTLMKELIVFSGTTPFGLKESAGAAKQLLAYGSTAKTVIGELRMLGDVASGVSVPIGDLVYLYGTLKTQGRAYAMDIRQFAGRGIPIYAELANVLKINKDQVADFVTAGKVGFPEVEQAFKNMTAAGSMFGGLMEAQSKTFNGQIERFKDAWDVMLNDMGKSQEDLFSDVISGAINAVENYNQVLDIIGMMVIAYGSYRAALIAYAVANQFATASVVVHGLSVRQLGVIETLVAAGKRTLISLQVAYNTVLAASPIGATIALLAALGTTIYAVTQYTDAAQASQNRYNDIQEESSLTAAKEKTNIEALVGVIRSHTATNEQRNAAYQKLQETTKGVLIGFSQEEIAAGKAKGAIDGYIKSIQEAARAKVAFSEFQKLNDQLAELEVKGTKSISMMDKAALRAQGLGNFIKLGLAGAGSGNAGIPENLKKQYQDAKNIFLAGDAGEDAILSAQKSNLTKQIEDLKKTFNKEINSELSKTGEMEAPTVYSKKRSVDTIDAEIAKIKEEQKSVAETSAQYASYEKQIVKLENEKAKITGRQSSAQKKEISERQKFLDKLLDIEAEASRKSLTKNEEDIKAAQDKADALRKEARENGLGPGVITRIDNIEIRETGDLKYRQDTENLKIALDKQTELYRAYEQVKNDLGESAAKERFDSEIDTNRTLLEDLEAQRALLLDKDSKDMTGRERDRLLVIDTKINDEVKAQKDAYNALLLANSTYEQQKAAATSRYNADFAALQGEENAGRRAVLTKAHQVELDQLSEAMLRKSEVYKKAAEESLIITREQTIKQIAALNKLISSGMIPEEQVSKIQTEIEKLRFTLKIGVDQGNINALKGEFKRVADQLNLKDENGTAVILSDDDYKAIIRRLAEIQNKIIEIDSNGDSKASWGDKLSKQFDYLKKGSTEMALGMSSDLGELSSGFNQLSDALGGNDTQAGYLLGTIGELAKVGSDAAGSFASFASGDIIGGVTKAVSAVAGLFSIGKRVKEMNAAARKEVEDFYKNAIAGERAYQDLLRERELQTIRNNKVALQGISDELKLRKEQNAAYLKEAGEIMAKLQGQSYIASESYTHGTWFRKAKVNKTFGSLQGMNFQQLSSLLSQGKLEGDAQALVQRLVELEQKGYDAEQAIADLAKETSELFTGTTASSLTDSLADMFASGKTSAQDLADFFKQSMDDAALSIFKNKVLAGAMESFYAEFDKAAQSGDELTADEMARLYGLFTSLTGDALKKFEDFKKITGSDLTGGSNNSEGIKGGVDKITATQADSFIGHFAGFRLTQLETNVLLKAQGVTATRIMEAHAANLIEFQRIAENTLRTANNTDRLERIETALVSMDKKMNNNANALAGTGR